MAATRGDHVRPGGTCASDVRGREWALIAPLLPGRGGLRVFCLLQTGCQWRMLPGDFPPCSPVYGYVSAWIAAGVLAHIHEALYRRSRELEGRGYRQ